MRDDLVGAAISQYRVVELIGRGGMATVYKAYHPALERFVAVKVLPTYFAHDNDFAERFKREARAIAHLEHPNILPIYDFGDHEGIPFIVTSFVPGGTLKDRIGMPLPLDWCARVLSQI